jgi:hypothetical protein
MILIQSILPFATSSDVAFFMPKIFTDLTIYKD